MVVLFFAVGVLSGFFWETKADIIEVKVGSSFIMEYPTTKWCPSCFDFAFNRTGDKICPKGFEVLDKTNQEKDAKAAYTKWLISCVEK